MNKYIVMDKIISIKGRKIHFKYSGSRNQIEEFEGIIHKTYNKVITILVNDNTLKSFSYSDVLTNNLEIVD